MWPNQQEIWPHLLRKSLMENFIFVQWHYYSNNGEGEGLQKFKEPFLALKSVGPERSV